jgi:hypothetical protein
MAKSNGDSELLSTVAHSRTDNGFLKGYYFLMPLCGTTTLPPREAWPGCVGRYAPLSLLEELSIEDVPTILHGGSQVESMRSIAFLKAFEKTDFDRRRL